MAPAPDLRAAIVTGVGDAASRLAALHTRVDQEMPNQSWLTSELHQIRSVLQGTIDDALRHGPDEGHVAVGPISEGPGGEPVEYANRPSGRPGQTTSGEAATPSGPVGVHRGERPARSSSSTAKSTAKRAPAKKAAGTRKAASR